MEPVLKVLLITLIPAMLLSAFLGQTDAGCGPTISITFDDGYQSVYTTAAPILAEYNATATTYAITGSVGDSFEGRPLMTWDQLQELAAAGWEVGSHSRTHPDLRSVDDARLHEEVNGSYEDLLDHNITPATMAAPYGFQDARVRDAVMSRYEGFRVTEWGANSLSSPNRSSLDAYWLHENMTWDRIRPDIVEGLRTGGWAIIMLHTVSTDSDYAYNTPPSTLRTILRFAERNTIDIKPVAEVLREC